MLSQYILHELARVLPKLTHRHGLNAQEIADLVDILAFHADIVEPDNRTEPRLTDPMDQPVLNAWRAAQADYLLTDDKALLALGSEYPILTPAQFWQVHKLKCSVSRVIFSRIAPRGPADKCFGRGGNIE